MFKGKHEGGFLMRKVASSFAVVLFAIAISATSFGIASAEGGGYGGYGAYVGVFGGYTFSPDSSWKNDNTGSEFDVDIQDSWAAGVKFGYIPPQWKYFSFELEYFYSNPDVNRTVFGSSAIEGDIKFHSFLYNIAVRYPEGRFHPYLGAGLGFSYADASIQSTSLSGSASTSENDTAFAWQILAGIDIDLTNSWTADIGYRYFSTEPKLGNISVEYKTSMVTLGLKYRF
jgi:opacity protein-like surface antigen